MGLLRRPSVIRVGERRSELVHRKVEIGDFKPDRPGDSSGPGFGESGGNYRIFFSRRTVENCGNGGRFDVARDRRCWHSGRRRVYCRSVYKQPLLRGRRLSRHRKSRGHRGLFSCWLDWLPLYSFSLRDTSL